MFSWFGKSCSLWLLIRSSHLNMWFTKNLLKPAGLCVLLVFQDLYVRSYVGFLAQFSVYSFVNTFHLVQILECQQAKWRNPEFLKAWELVWHVWGVADQSCSPVWYWSRYPIRIPFGSLGFPHSKLMVSKPRGFIVKNPGTSGTTITHIQYMYSCKQETTQKS